MYLGEHPSELNSFQQYRRSVKAAKSTSRMRNPAWYEDALGLEYQIHCYLSDETGARCYLHVRSSGVFEKLPTTYGACAFGSFVSQNRCLPFLM